MRANLFIALLLLGINMHAQEKKLRNFHISSTLGVYVLEVEQNPITDQLDFMNYIDSYPDYIEDILLKIGFQFDFLQNYTAEIQLIMQSDLCPNNFDISAHKNISNRLSLGAGMFCFKDYISHFEEYYYEKMPAYYIMDRNMMQNTVYDVGYYITPSFYPIKTDRFSILARCDAGFTALSKESAAFVLKKKGSNFRMEDSYETHKSYSPFVNPKLRMNFTVLKIGNTSVDLLAMANYFYTSRSIAYTLSHSEWTVDNTETTTIEPPKHSFSRLNIDVGMSVGW